MIRYNNIARRYKEIESEYQDYYLDILNREAIFNDYYVNQVEKKLAEIANKKHALLTISGSSSLLLSLYCNEIGPGDEVIVPNYSCVPSLSYVLVAGATPVFCEIDHTGNMDPQYLTECLSKRTKAVVATGLYGDMHYHEEIESFCREHNLIYINDAAQSMFASRNGVTSFSTGDIITTSFSENKPLPSLGSCGAILTDDTEKFYKLLHLRKHGKPYRKSAYTKFGINAVPNEDRAAQVLCSMNRFDNWQKRRHEIADYYDKTFLSAEVTTRPHSIEWNTHKYAVMFQDKLLAQALLKKEQVETEAHYTDCLGPDSPNGVKFVKQSLSIPLNPQMTDAEVEFTANAVIKIWKQTQH